MMYDDKIKYSVLRIFGKESEVYQALLRGEKISKLIKASYNKKGVKILRIREKKMLFEECKKQEQNCEDIAGV